MVNFGRALERCGEILKAQAPKVYVLPGNHESASQITAFCRQFGLHDFHGQTLRLGRYHVAGLGYSNPTPFDTPGEYSEAELADRLTSLRGASSAGAGLPLSAVRYAARSDSGRASTQVPPPCAISCAASSPEYFFCGHIHEAAGASAEFGSTRAFNVGKKGYLLELD